MNYTFEVMTQEQAEEIAFKWHYEDKYSFYDMEADQEDLVEFLDPKIRGETTFAVSENNRLVGFFSFNKVDIHTVDIGLGMKPNLTGNGLGLVFIKAGLVFCEKKDQPKYITLSVATFNQRAINVYKKAGFEAVGTFIQETNGSRFEFFKMMYVTLCPSR
ncbi:GNAT family N-acetyltransferase [Bacillus pseudomycoides]|uniref:GNAT family N-acetyltransferase n=1 Tax=Bacillus pseudomycoides TaxID=64104 RepID=A0A2B5HC81_9BACI|nr:GNAT family protein [Bacillus pseudomycoides]PDY46568.1 GNAT family N-acetyltransferase [Bacillus pseudomycoides]PEA83219.1 GNAT family N-acetyltransferase [Bacillus pseudomycoides]PED71910.1 GNAT family N-acetyltransferase [Bacillus pseudomycoides]PEI36141.1 GNAT family N-acetyltransferase [Bacillus pseudomycoides]PEJ74433.1 GNAT family N-acetyltransferase [Bacillus pseudomycoides]